jgi:SAM-dependent methyltransferase
VTTTERAKFDKYAYYRASAQGPDGLMVILDQFYSEARGGAKPRTLREDFCGTFDNCCAWVRRGPERRAVGVDLDSEPLVYGCAHYRPRLRLLEQLRIRVIQDNVLTPGLPNADMIVALNLSYFVFKTRVELLAYFRNCMRTLEPGGMLVLDCLGGSAHHKPNEQSQHKDGFTYFFEQEGFDPVTHEALFHIHFQRDGERKRRRVFTYDWRIWTVPELRDALLEAGFDAVRTYWPQTTEEGELLWYLADQADDEQSPNWWSFVVGLR